MSSSLLDALNALVGDRFAVEREIGRGGMGAVFLARERALERRVAIKVLPPELAARADLRERFLRETRTAAAFSHPHIVPVHAVEERGGLLLFVMGFVEGETLGARVRRLGPLGAADAARLLREVGAQGAEVRRRLRELLREHRLRVVPVEREPPGEGEEADDA